MEDLLYALGLSTRSQIVKKHLTIEYDDKGFIKYRRHKVVVEVVQGDSDIYIVRETRQQELMAENTSQNQLSHKRYGYLNF